MAQAGDGDAIGDQSGEDLIAVAVILVVEIGLERVVGAVVERAVKFLELGSVADGQGTERDGIDEAEDRGVGADAERHRDDGEKGEAGTLEKLARAVAEILEKCLHVREFPDEMREACDLDSENVGGAFAHRQRAYSEAVSRDTKVPPTLGIYFAGFSGGSGCCQSSTSFHAPALSVCQI